MNGISPDVLCLTESKVCFSSIKNSYWQSMAVQLVVLNDRAHSMPNLWVLCSRILVQSVCTIKSSSLY